VGSSLRVRADTVVLPYPDFEPRVAFNVAGVYLFITIVNTERPGIVPNVPTNTHNFSLP